VPCALLGAYPDPYGVKPGHDVKKMALATMEEAKMRLQNKIGIVTAAGSGMGRAGALRFAKEGAAVGVVDLNGDAANAVVRQINDAGGKAMALVGDLTGDDFARDIVRQTARQFGGLDFVWNHVGTPGPASIEGIDWKDFDFAMNLNVRTVLVTTEAALPELRARGGGALLFTASTSGLVGSPYSPVYNIAKFGVVGLVKGLAKRYGHEKIRVNAVCPGTTDTPMLRVFVARPDSQLPPGETPETLVVKRGGLNPMRRVAQPEEIANAALFLISDEASFVNGVALAVDGGATA
jgi:NAD(P)-dependent dehydrogenase (short-subunit alcohol dehydrogenase family)